MNYRCHFTESYGGTLTITVEHVTVVIGPIEKMWERQEFPEGFGRSFLPDHLFEHNPNRAVVRAQSRCNEAYRE